MTYSEDVKRISSYWDNLNDTFTNPDTVDYLNARIEVLEKRIEFLEAQNEINNKNK